MVGDVSDSQKYPDWIPVHPCTYLFYQLWCFSTCFMLYLLFYSPVCINNNGQYTENWTQMCMHTTAIVYLKQAANQGFLRRGIGEQCKFTSSIHDETLQTVCQSIMHMAGSSILDVMIIYYTKWHKRLQSSYYSELNSLKVKFEPSKFQEFVK